MKLKLFSHTKLADDLSNSKTFRLGVYSVLGIVAAGMTVLNIFTHKGLLTWVTGVFALCCAANIALVLLSEKTGALAGHFFAVELVAMFGFFLVSGNPDGFSAIWIVLLPFAALYFFGRLWGILICAAMELILMFFLWLPYGRQYLMYDYNATFKMRFPVLFLAFCAVAVFLETRREFAYAKMNDLQDYYHELSVRDSLTKLYNRQGMYARLEEVRRETEDYAVTVAMFDIDNFKKINDTYGHDTGDDVLKLLAKIMREKLPGVICRWGGEEFVAIMTESEFLRENLENIRSSIEEYCFQKTDSDEIFHFTVSIGVTQGAFEVAQIDSLISDADVALYKAKTTGKNKIVYFTK